MPVLPLRPLLLHVSFKLRGRGLRRRVTRRGVLFRLLLMPGAHTYTHASGGDCDDDGLAMRRATLVSRSGSPACFSVHSYIPRYDLYERDNNILMDRKLYKMKRRCVISTLEVRDDDIVLELFTTLVRNHCFQLHVFD